MTPQTVESYGEDIDTPLERTNGMMPQKGESYLVCIVVVLLATACGSAQEHDHGGVSGGAEAGFAAFAGLVYEELGRMPLDEDFDSELGLFGDMSVVAGESIVMGRYRYLVDAGTERPEGYMAFFVRDAGSEAVAAVTLEFVAGDGGWYLHDGSYESMAESDARALSFHSSLVNHFDSWVASAVQRAHAGAHVR